MRTTAPVISDSSGTAAFMFTFIPPGLHEFDTLNDQEVNDFRSRMRQFCEETALQRQHMNWDSWMESNFPLQLEHSSKVFAKISQSNKTIMINVKFESSEVSARCAATAGEAVPRPCANRRGCEGTAARSHSSAESCTATLLYGALCLR